MKRLILSLFAFAGISLAQSTVVNGDRKILGYWDASSATYTAAVRWVLVDPVTCNATVKEQVINYAGSPPLLKICLTSNTWTTVGAASGGSGTVTSVALSLPNIFSVSGSPVTVSGTLTATLATQTANTVFRGPTSGAAATPSFGALVSADMPATVVQTGQLNTYTSGSKQTFTASGATAGLNIAAATLPSGPATGDLAVDSANSNALNVYTGSAWKALSAASVYTLVSSSATPAFVATVGAPVSSWKTILTTSAVPTLTTSGVTAGSYFNFRICQDGTGSRTFTWPATVLQAPLVDATINTCTNASALWDGTNATVFFSSITDSSTPAIPTATGTLSLPTTALDTIIGRKTLIPQGVTVSGLSGLSPVTGQIANVTDGIDNFDCTSGSGAVAVTCKYDGSAWAPLSLYGSFQLSDFRLVKTAASVATVNPGASATSPANVQINTTIYSFTGAGTVTVSGSPCTSGANGIYWYVSSAGAITMGHSGLACTFTGSGVTIATPIAAFPEGSVPLGTMTVTANVWSATVVDKRAFLSSGFSCSGGITCSGSGISADTSVLDTRVNNQSSQDKTIADVAVTDTYLCTVAASGLAIPTFGAGTVGSVWSLVPVTANTGAATCQGLTILTSSGGALSNGDIAANKANLIKQWDSTTLRLVSSAGTSVPVLSTTGQGWQYIPFDTPLSTSVGDTYGGGDRKTSPFYFQFIGKGITINKIILDFPTYAGSAGGVAIAIYDAATTTKLGQVTSQSVTPAQRTTTFTLTAPLTLALNTVYYLGIASENNNIVTYEQSVGGNNPEMTISLNEGSNNYRYFRGDQAATGTGVSLAMPATAGTKGTAGAINALPLVLLLP